MSLGDRLGCVLEAEVGVVWHNQAQVTGPPAASPATLPQTPATPKETRAGGGGESPGALP